MKKQTRFLALGAPLVAGVAFLVYTATGEAAVYYYTPDELAAKVATDPTTHEVGLKVGGRVVPGTIRYDQTTLDLQFHVVDITTGKTSFPVHYNGPLPDTFQEGRDVVIEGRYTEAGVFEATTVLTKCGSRYEAAEGDFQA